MLSFEQLTTPVTEEEAAEELKERLHELGFASRSWQSGSVQLTIMMMVAWLYAKFTTFVAAIVFGLLNETATGEFLTRFSRSHYDNERTEAIAAQYTVRFTIAAGEGPHSVDAQDVAVTNGAFVYRNVESATLPSDDTIDLVVEAEIPGAAANTADGTITTLITTLAGVTVTNPANSQVRAGADAEDDPELRQRNRTRWSTLAIDMPADGYANVVLGVAGIARAEVDDGNPRGPGTVDVYAAGINAPAGSEDIDEAQERIDLRKSVTADVEVKAPAETTVGVSGTVYYRSSFSEAPGQIDAAVADYINTLPIGGQRLTSVTRGVAGDAVIEAIRGIPGVVNVDVSAADTVLAPFALAVAAGNIPDTLVKIAL